MIPWLFPMTYFFAGLLIWLFQVLFFPKKYFNLTMILSIMVSSIGLIILLYRQYYYLVVVLIFIVCLIAILYFGLKNSNHKTEGDGPLTKYIGKEGMALTYLEPKGKIQVEGESVAAISEGVLIPKDASVMVVRCNDKIVVVKEIK